MAKVVKVSLAVSTCIAFLVLAGIYISAYEETPYPKAETSASNTTPSAKDLLHKADFEWPSSMLSTSLESVGCQVGNSWDVPGLRLICQPAIVINKKLSLTQMTDDFFGRFLMRRQIECYQAEWVGTPRDGGWNVCIAPPYKPQPGCLIYSIGIALDWTFDDTMYKKFACHVFSFDPSIKASKREGVAFFKIGLAGKNYTKTKKKGWKTKSWQQILIDTGHKKDTIDYLKFDIEGGEFDALEEALKDGSLLQVKQIGFEAHFGIPRRKEEVMKWYRLLSSLENTGFQMWSHPVNPFVPCFKSKSGQQHCRLVNLHYVNLRFLKAHMLP